MAIGEFAPGYYSMTYDGNDAGLVVGPRELRRAYRYIPIDSDKYGDDIDGIYKTGPVFLQMTFIEWTSTIRSILWPFDTDFGKIGKNGRLLSDLAKPIVLTAEAGLPAASKGPATISPGKAIIAPENETRILLGNVKRDVPVVFRLWPYLDSGDLRNFSTTNPA